MRLVKSPDTDGLVPACAFSQCVCSMWFQKTWANSGAAVEHHLQWSKALPVNTDLRVFNLTLR